MAEKEKRDEQTHIILNTRNCMEFLLERIYLEQIGSTHKRVKSKSHFHKWLVEEDLITKEELERLNKIK